MIYDKIIQLNQQKLAAVEQEDFDSAKHFKEFIDKLKVLGNQLLNLQADKNMAIENEDYDLAKQYKVKMDQIKDVAYQVVDPYYN